MKWVFPISETVTQNSQWRWPNFSQA